MVDYRVTVSGVTQRTYIKNIKHRRPPKPPCFLIHDKMTMYLKRFNLASYERTCGFRRYRFTVT